MNSQSMLGRADLTAAADEGSVVGSLWVRHVSASSAVVREAILTALLEAGAPVDEAHDGALIVTELFGNAVRHAPALASGHLAVEWNIDDSGYLLSVTDGGMHLPVRRREAGASDTSGRGLAIIDAVADEWGVSSSDVGTTVWARCKASSRWQQSA